MDHEPMLRNCYFALGVLTQHQPAKIEAHLEIVLESLIKGIESSEDEECKDNATSAAFKVVA